MHEVVLQQALSPIEVSPDVADDFKREHGDKVETLPTALSDQTCTVSFEKGAVLMVPKA